MTFHHRLKFDCAEYDAGVRSRVRRFFQWAFRERHPKVRLVSGTHLMVSAEGVTISIGGVSRQVPAKEALLTRLMSQALTDKTQDAALFVSRIKTILPEQFAQVANDELNANEARLIEAIAKMLRARQNNKDRE